mgnify:CR=1 FL=1
MISERSTMGVRLSPSASHAATVSRSVLLPTSIAARRRVGPCVAVDFHQNGKIDLADHAVLADLLAGPIR